MKSTYQDIDYSSSGTEYLNFLVEAEKSAKQKKYKIKKSFSFGTKAETLCELQPLLKKSEVPQLLYFTVAEWKADTSNILFKIQQRFAGESLVIRSSAQNEDGIAHSQAGAFTSCLNIESGDSNAVNLAIQNVIDSFDNNLKNQVLVMRMLKDVVMSGVIMTHELGTGAPYYVLNYDSESGKTDTITSGIGMNKTVMVHREFASGHVDSPRVAELLDLTREIEGLCERGISLDIEFAKRSDGRLYLLQARRISVQKNWNRRIARHVGEVLFQAENFITHHSRPKPHVVGSRTILGKMPDWNPAEIIGTHPKPLAVSLYRYLITDSVWQEARASMGYQPVPYTPLMITLGGQPYIDVRASFNSFLPAKLSESIRKKLVDAWLNRLEMHPEYHDKVEFEVAQTIIDLNFNKNYKKRYCNVLNHDEYLEYQYELTQLTIENLSLHPDASLPTALRQIEQLVAIQSLRNGESTNSAPLEKLPVMLDECRNFGTRPFSIIARHAFIAETIWRSAVSCKVFAESRLDEFKRSLQTITTDFTNDYYASLHESGEREKFLLKYGHLRPGTYDITSPRYDQRDDLFGDATIHKGEQVNNFFQLNAVENELLTNFFESSGLGAIDPEKFIEYARQSISNRERAKFIFTRHLSDALELISCWGKTQGLDRDELSHLNIQDFLNQLISPVLKDPELHYKDLIEHRRREMENVKGVRLGYLIRDPRDLYVVPLHRSAPNFVTDQRIEGQPFRLNNQTRGNCELAGHIICIENADPGFDWIFTRGIAGLVSKFGGANSHMTIRCAEMGLPAAIGVGEQTFKSIIGAERVELDGSAHIIRPIYG